MKSPVIFDKFIYLLIIFNVAAMILESHVSIRNVYGNYFNVFEAISIYIFSFEYLYRIRLAYLDKRMKGVKKYIFSTFGLIDLISILPFFLNQFVKVDGRFLRILRLFRLTRIFKLGRDSSSLQLFVSALKGVQNELKFTLFLSALAILFSASAIYYLENEVQPEKFSSITESIWWATVSLATVGYGDVYPVTVGGKVFASVISLIGIGIVAIPTGIISASFVEEINKVRRGEK
ncbi:MAG: ion transporter [Flavobacteriaceae bacterium]|nr:ion transporter [Flavobacteriaceae bacterium]MDC3238952.1 ion transporter [Flavobacteriaceae bacterium]RPG66113.1 MAG: ion transporter [Flavobacteriaceae bacterium TMED42]